VGSFQDIAEIMEFITDPKTTPMNKRTRSQASDEAEPNAKKAKSSRTASVKKGKQSAPGKKRVKNQ
jgi:hypothetical protein